MYKLKNNKKDDESRIFKIIWRVEVFTEEKGVNVNYHFTCNKLCYNSIDMCSCWIFSSIMVHMHVDNSFFFISRWKNLHKIINWLWFKDQDNLIFTFLKSLYGMNQASRKCIIRFNEFMEKKENSQNE